MKLKLPNTFVLLFALLALIALSTWFVPGGQYDTQMVNAKRSSTRTRSAPLPATRRGWWPCLPRRSKALLKPR